jgi:membrane protein YdbS with pleckstrin-like domain
MHWLSLIPAFFYIFMAFVLLMNLGNVAPYLPDYPVVAQTAKIILLLLATLLLARAARDVLIFLTTELGFTDKLLLGKVGLWRVRTVLTPLNKINHVSTTIGFLGRFLGYGNVIIHSSSGQITYEQIASNLQFIAALMERIETAPGGQGEAEDKSARAPRPVSRLFPEPYSPPPAAALPSPPSLTKAPPVAAREPEESPARPKSAPLELKGETPPARPSHAPKAPPKESSSGEVKGKTLPLSPKKR